MINQNSSNSSGTLVYPYSMRELVSLAKHMHAFPNDSIANALANVFDFDRYQRDTYLRLVAEFGVLWN